VTRDQLRALMAEALFTAIVLAFLAVEVAGVIRRGTVLVLWFTGSVGMTPQPI